MRSILLPDLDETRTYALVHDGHRWTVTAMVLDHRTADATYGVRFASVVGTGRPVDVGVTDLDLVPGLSTTLTVLESGTGTEGGGNQ